MAAIMGNFKRAKSAEWKILWCNKIDCSNMYKWFLYIASSFYKEKIKVNIRKEVTIFWKECRLCSVIAKSIARRYFKINLDEI